MKTRTLLVLLVGFSIIAGLHAREDEMRRVEMPAQKTGTGSHDFYNLGALAGDKPGSYYICVSAHKKFVVDGIGATLDDVPLGLGDKGEVKALAGLVKNQVVMLLPTREQMERGTKMGGLIKITSARGAMEFRIPSEQFAAMLKEARIYDNFAIRAEAAREREERKKAEEAKAALARAALKKRAETAIALVRQESFDGYGTPGTAAVTGQAFLRTRGGEVRVGAGNYVNLIPDREGMAALYDALADGFALADLPGDIVVLMAKVSRSCQADASGNFEFQNVPAARYRLQTEITWDVPGYYGTTKTGGKVVKVVTLEPNDKQRVMLTE